MTQSMAYRHIRALKHTKYTGRPRTKFNLQTIKEEAKALLKLEVSDTDIWTTIRHKDLARTTRYFLWMAIHDAYMIGTNWL